MILSSQQLAEVVGFVRDARRPSAGAERRRVARMDLQHRVAVTAITKDGAAGATYTVLTRDISPDGIGFLTARPVPVGDALVIHLPRSARDTIAVFCRSMFCGTQADGIYVIGAQFSRVLEHHELHPAASGGNAAAPAATNGARVTPRVGQAAMA